MSESSDLPPRREMMVSEFMASLRVTKRGSGRIHVPPEITRNYLPGQLMKVRIEGDVGNVVVI